MNLWLLQNKKLVKENAIGILRQDCSFIGYLCKISDTNVDSAEILNTFKNRMLFSNEANISFIVAVALPRQVNLILIINDLVT